MKKEELLKEIQDLDKHIKLLHLKKEELLAKTESLEDLSKFDKLKMWYKHSEHESCKDFPNCYDKVNIQSFKDLMVPLLEEAKNGNMESFDLHWWEFDKDLADEITIIGSQYMDKLIQKLAEESIIVEFIGENIDIEGFKLEKGMGNSQRNSN